MKPSEVIHGDLKTLQKVSAFASVVTAYRK